MAAIISKSFTRNLIQRPKQIFPLLSKRISELCVDRVVDEKELVCCSLVPGDNVGPELIKSLQTVFVAAKVPIRFICFNISDFDPDADCVDDLIASIQQNKVCIMAPILSNEKGMHDELTIFAKLRLKLDLYANVTHIRNLNGVRSRYKNVDCVVIRELTEGEYNSIEHEVIPGVVECYKVVTREKSLRIAKFAFDYATINQRKKVTVVHKANIMKASDGLFLKMCKEVSTLYPKIKYDTIIVDNAAAQAVTNPNQFDVILSPNLYGSLLNNLFTGLVGGAGVVPGSSYSSEEVVFEPGARRTFPTGVGKNIANPLAMLLCGTKLLRHLNLISYSTRILNAIQCTLDQGTTLTPDLCGEATTEEFTCAVLDNLEPKD